MSETYKREDGTIIWIKNSGGWAYNSSCGKFRIVNLEKVDSDSKGWVLRDSREEYIGTFKTLKSAKQAAEEIK